MNFKTNAVLSEEEAAVKWQEFRAYRQSSIKNYDFSYKNKCYTFEYDDHMIDEDKVVMRAREKEILSKVTSGL